MEQIHPTDLGILISYTLKWDWEMKRNIQTFIIWKNARAFEEDILNKIKSNFTILKEYEITWTPELFGENLSAFYGDNFIYNMYQRKIRGEGAFVFIIAEDTNPNYINVTANRGEVQVNEKAFKLKQEVRELLKTFSFHSSNDVQEARHNIALLLGKNLNDFLNSTELDGKREILHQDIPSARGWKSLSEFFYILNETCNYVLLRGFDAIPDTHIYAQNGDIDILVDDIKKFLAILNPTIPTNKNAFHFFNWEDFGEDNKHLLIHPKFVGDNYYDTNMQRKMLETKILNSKGVYVPSDEMYFWSLLHHGIFHKENWQKYDAILKELARKIGVNYKADKEYLCNLLTDYMMKNGYHVAWHLDANACSLIPENIKDKSLFKEPVLYCYKNSAFKFVVFSEEAIFYEPELVTEFISQYDIFLDLHRHVLDKNSNIYKFIKSRMLKNEYLWSFSKRKDKYSLFSYKNKDDIKSFDKRFVPRQTQFSTKHILYKEDLNIKYINCKIKVEDILLGTLVKVGYQAFIQELDKFISELFYKYELFTNSNYLKEIAWDYLPRNVFFDDNNYIFFDREAKYIKPIRKSQCIANIVLDLNNNFYFNETEKYNLYKYFINKYNLEDIWAWSVTQREKEVGELLYTNKVNCYEEVNSFIENCINENFDIISTENNQTYNNETLEKLDSINMNLQECEHVLLNQYQTINTQTKNTNLPPLVSVIIPVYNCGKYIVKTLDSVLAQSLKNIEIICINDGSNDNSLEILNKYAQLDKRIIVINKENGGQSSARNRGLEIAKGEYIGFVDADDRIPENYYQALYENAINSNADIVQCRAIMVHENTELLEPWVLNNDILNLDSRNPNLNKLLLTYASGFVWNKIYRKTLFNNIRFIEGIYWEDNPFILEISLKANKILSIPDVYYYYLQREGSTVYSKNSKIHFDLLKSSEYIINFLNNPQNNISKKDYSEFVHSLICRLNLEYEKAFKNPNVTRKERKKYKKTHHRLLFKIKELSLSEKLNYSFELQHLKKHFIIFAKPFKIVEYIFRLFKYVVLAPYYLFKEGWK